MRSELRHRALYAAFDRVPARKGAAVHVARFAPVLFGRHGGGLLYVLGGEGMPARDRDGDVEVLRFGRTIPNLLRRALAFGEGLRHVLDRHAHTLELCHFRDPWSGVPIVTHPRARWSSVYEVNGLPSIELPCFYPALGPRTVERLRAHEALCWTRADRIVVPSDTLRANLERLGADPAKITVIPNGADLAAPAPRPAEAPVRYLLYFGALQPWQGVDVLLRAFARLVDLSDLGLVICSSAPERRAAHLQRLAGRLGVMQRVLWRFQLPEPELAPWRQHAAIAVAPLTDCPRNLAQGCCPLKILEAMAAGVPVVASDLPAVREILVDGEHGRLVRPDRPEVLARTLRVLLEYPQELQALGSKARDRIQRDFTWQRATQRLDALYGELQEPRRTA